MQGQLVLLLTGIFRSAYVHREVDNSLDDDKVKEAILQKYNINPETNRHRFLSIEVQINETPKELYVRLKEL